MKSLVTIYTKAKQLVWTSIAKRRLSAYNGSVKCNYRCVFNRNTHLGSNCNFNGMMITGYGKVTIGDNFHSGRNCQIITSSHNYDTGTMIPYDETFISKDVVIGDNVWLGNNVIILGGSQIGDGSIIQAGSVVCGGSIPTMGIAGGHPARVFKYRDEEHYNNLVAQGRFH